MADLLHERGESGLRGPTGRAADAESRAVWVAAAVAVPVALATIARLNAIDLAYHLRAGRYMIEHREVLDRDLFTFTAAGADWFNQQWLSQVVLATVLDAGGWFGLAVLRGVLVGLTAWLVFASCRSQGAGDRTAALLVLAGAALALPTMNLRPQLLVVPCFAVAHLILVRRDTHPRQLWFLPPIAVLWANLHGSFPLLFVLGGGALLADLVARRAQWRMLAVVGVITLLATLANPRSVEVWAYVAGLTTDPIVTRYVGEWERPSFASYAGTAFLVSIPVVAWILLRSRARPSWPALLVLAAFLVPGLGATRMTLWWGLVAPVILAPCFAPGSRSAPSSRVMNAVTIATFAGLAAAMFVRWLPYRSPDPVPGHLLADAPTGVVEELRRRLAPGDRVFAPQAWGSWVEFALPDNPVAVDARIEAIPDSVWRQYGLVSRGAAGWQRILDDWQVRAIAAHVDLQSGLLAVLSSESSWVRVRAEQVGAVYVRR
jgi:hypothetical protein